GSNGGRRLGAGRPKGSLNKVKQVATDVAAKALSRIDQLKVWQELIESKDERIRLESMKYLNDRAFGRPAQLILGDPHKPVAVHLTWGAPAPDWLQNVVDVELHEPNQLKAISDE